MVTRAKGKLTGLNVYIFVIFAAQLVFFEIILKMPQEIHVVQCCSCLMYQVDIVKKVHKWSCKLCGLKQSLKTVLFKGSGKECRLHVQKLNESKISKEQNRSTDNITTCFSQSSGVTSLEALEAAKAASEINWTEFLESNDENKDVIDVKDLNEGSTERLDEFSTTVQEKCNKEEDKTTNENHRRSIELSESSKVPSTLDNSRAKRIQENFTDPVAKLRKIDTNIPTQPNWDQYLPDELSD